MANLVITLTDNTTRSSTPNRVVVRPQNAANRPVADADVNRVDTEAEASLALNTVADYLDHAPGLVDLTRLGIRVGSRSITLPEIGRAYPSLQDRIARIQGHQRVIPAAPLTPPPPAVDPAAPPAPPPSNAPVVVAPPLAPAAPVVTEAPAAPAAPARPSPFQRGGLSVAADVLRLSQSGNAGGTSYTGTDIRVGGIYNFINRPAGSIGVGGFARFLHIGGDGDSLGNLNGGGAALAASLRWNIVPFVSLLLNGNVGLHYVTGRNQIPGRADTAASSGFGFDLGASLALLFAVGRGVYLGPQVSYLHSETPDAQEVLGQEHDNIFNGWGAGLALTFHPFNIPPARIAAAHIDLCSGRTPENMNEGILALRNILGQLRAENIQLRTTVQARFPALDFAQRPALREVAVHAQEANNAVIPEDCAGKQAALDALADNIGDLYRQNGYLEGLGDAPSTGNANDVHHMMQVGLVTYVPMTPYTTASTGYPLDNIRSGMRNNANSPLTIEGIQARTAQLSNNGTTVISPEDRRTTFAAIFQPETNLQGQPVNHTADTLDGIISALNGSYRGYSVLVLTAADHNADHTYNQRLTDRRAAAGVEYLVSGGVARSRLIGIGLGEDEPVYFHDIRRNSIPEDRQFVVPEAERRTLRGLGLRDRDIDNLILGRAATNRYFRILLYRPEDVQDANNHNGDNDQVRRYLARVQPQAPAADAGVSPATTLAPAGDAGRP